MATVPGLSYLPRVEQELVKQWDTRRNACCGYLNKKAGKTSSLSRGKWQKRWFVLKIQLTGHENYSLVHTLIRHRLPFHLL